jgi:hypothetical protein
MELSLAITKATGGCENASRLWRNSNLIRHHLVAIPLLNYTNYEGNLAAPAEANGLVIDNRKVSNTPRYVHFDECLGFVDSGCTKYSNKDSVTRANEVFSLFHGSEHADVTSEIINGEETE